MAITRTFTLAVILSFISILAAASKLISLIAKKQFALTEFLKLGLFYNIPIRYFMLVSLDLYISATISAKTLFTWKEGSRRNLADTRQFLISGIFALIFLVASLWISIGNIIYMARKKEVEQISARASQFHSGLVKNSKTKVIFYFSWFFLARMLVATLVACLG